MFLTRISNEKRENIYFFRSPHVMKWKIGHHFLIFRFQILEINWIYIEMFYILRTFSKLILSQTTYTLVENMS